MKKTAIIFGAILVLAATGCMSDKSSTDSIRPKANINVENVKRSETGMIRDGYYIFDNGTENYTFYSWDYVVNLQEGSYEYHQFSKACAQAKVFTPDSSYRVSPYSGFQKVQSFRAKIAFQTILYKMVAYCFTGNSLFTYLVFIT